MTVSRALNDSGYVSRSARARIQAAVAELNFVPNRLAGSLRHHRTSTLALVLTDITNPFFTTIARGVEDTASEQGFNVMYCNTDESEPEQAEQLSLLVQKRVDGILLVSAGLSAEPIKFLQEHDVPVVLIDRRIPGVAIDCVCGDSEQGAYELTRLLLGLGHRRIAMLSGPRDVSTAAERVAGYRRALAEAGIPGSGAGDNVDDLVHWGAFTLASGYQLTQELLAISPRPTAVFAANNFLAIGSYRALRAAGLRVPADVAIVAFDDLPASLILEPFLTVASQPAYEMGCRATELLLARLSGRAPAEAAGPQNLVLPTEIVVRGSSGPVITEVPLVRKEALPVFI
jgi:LacI family transcriptional regulator